MIFKLCGTPSEEYWKKLKLSTTFRPPQSYKPALFDVFGDFPSSSLGLLKTLLSLDPAYRGSVSLALQNEVSKFVGLFFAFAFIPTMCFSFIDFLL